MVAAKSQNRTRQDGRQNFERTDHKFVAVIAMNIVMSVHLRVSVNDLRIVNAASIVVKMMKIMSVAIVAFEARSDRRFDKNRQGYYR